MLATTTTTVAARYTGTARAFHWVLAVAIVCVFCVGLYAEGLPFSPSKLKLMNWHKWAGVSILVLSVARLLWRWAHRPPALPQRIEQAMPAWQRVAYHGVHQLMYVLFLAVPLLGWAYSSARGYPIVWFGALPLPDFVPVSASLAKTIKPWHGWAAYTLMALATLHVLAALKHQFIDRDGLIRRMF